MTLLKLGIVFIIIIALLAVKRPLYQAFAGGLLITAVLYRIPLPTLLRQTGNVFTNWTNLSVLISLYLIALLQRMLEMRSQIKLAQQDLNGLFHNRRVNAVGAPLFIGLLPSAAAMILCGDIVKEATDGFLKPRDQAFVTSWIRHIPESVLPTYSGVLLMSGITGIPMSRFMPAMVIPALALGFLGYFPYLHRLPKDPGTPVSASRAKDALHLVSHLWTLIAILVLILVGKLSVVTAIIIVILAAIVIYRFRPAELPVMLRSAFDAKLLLNTFMVLVFKEWLACTGALEALPEALSVLPLPPSLVFSLLFFIGGIISGTNGIIALGTPLAFSAMDGGLPLMVLLMCISHAASQVSPTHVCLVVASDYYHITLGELIRKTLPPALLFCAAMYGYYHLLAAFV